MSIIQILGQVSRRWLTSSCWCCLSAPTPTLPPSRRLQILGQRNPASSVTQNFMAYPREVLYQACSAAARLNDQLDFDFHNVFHVIFKASVCTQNTSRYCPEYDHAWGPTAGVPWQIVSDTMFGLGNNWRSTDNRIDAHLRIYCDDGARYEHSANGQLWDTVEHFNRPAGDGGVHACQEQTFHRCYVTHLHQLGDTGGRVRRAILLRHGHPSKPVERPRPAGPVPTPRTIDRAQMAYGGEREREREGGREKDDMHNLPVFSLGLEQMPVQTLFHEWMHAMPFLGQDYPDARGMSGSWDHVITLFTEQALHAPEAYTYLGLWAALADLSPSGYLDANGRGGGYTIDRFWGIRPEETKWDQNFLEDNTGETDNPAFRGWIMA
ncbi:Putative protein of unknown function [Podospora comata]|uniref:Lysine-specific metallo-endopeptidase domain-containing protein n=1 Tax=Podospora comata TaxID=48703 RepID=A0ABY6S590_PODCO|nr:Putative protein of unknown function [Podospora comata]